MPTTAIAAKEYTQQTSAVTVKGVATQPDDLTTLAPPISCEIGLQLGEKSKTLTGDHVLLRDLIATVDRYLKFLLQGEPQGTFSGTVAIRPLDAVRHRLTVRQGDGIAQADLTMTQLYDLAESLAEIRTAIPHLDDIQVKERRQTALGQPAGIAAIAVGAIGTVIALALLTTGGPTNPDGGRTENGTPANSQTSAPPAGAPPQPEASAQNAGAARQQAPADSQARTAAPDTAASESATAPSTAAPSEPAAAVASEAAIASQLQQKLQAEWKAPADLPEPLVYRVTTTQDGSLLTVQPQGETATSRLGQTPLGVEGEQAGANLGDRATSPDSADNLKLEVILKPDSTVEVKTEP
jgi:hypothetical protein